MADTYTPISTVYPVGGRLKAADLNRIVTGVNLANSRVIALQTKVDGKADTGHTHAIADITNLQATLDGKAATGHTHAIADTSGLQAALDGKLLKGTLTDLNTLLNSTSYGAYGFAGTAANRPPFSLSSTNGVMLHLPNSSSGTGSVQVAMSSGNTPEWFVRYTGSSHGAWQKMSAFNFGTVSDLNAAPDGWAAVLSSSATNLPAPFAGVVETIPVSTNKLQTFTAWTDAPTTYRRRYTSNNTTWSAWAAVPTSATTDALNTRVTTLENAPVPSGAKGTKVVPLALTLPTGSNTLSQGSGAVRLDRSYTHMPRRVRVHMANTNYGYTFSNSGADTTATITLGVGDGKGGMTSPVSAGTITIPGNGLSEGVTPWITLPDVTDGGHLVVSYSWTTADGSATTVQRCAASCWSNTDPSVATAADTSGWTWEQSYTPFAAWLEAEVPANAPVVAAVGDSITCGVGSSSVGERSWLATYCRATGAIPVHMSMSGSTMSRWISGFRGWKMYPGIDLSVVDAVISTLGQNDLIDTSLTLTDMQNRHNTHMDALREIYKKQPVYLGGITPSGKDAPQEQIRRDFNTWRTTLPKGERGVIPWAKALDPNDETPSTAMAADLLHPTDAGVAEMLKYLYVRPVSPWTPSGDKLKAVLGSAS